MSFQAALVDSAQREPRGANEQYGVSAGLDEGTGNFERGKRAQSLDKDEADARGYPQSRHPAGEKQREQPEVVRLHH